MNTERRQLVEIKFHAHAINSPKVVPPKPLTDEHRAKVQYFLTYAMANVTNKDLLSYRIRGFRSLIKNIHVSDKK